MADVIVGEKVINKAKETGTIISFDGEYITVDFNTRVVQLLGDSFEKGFLKYEDADLQREVDESIERARQQEEQEKEERRIALKKAKEEQGVAQKAIAKRRSEVTISAAKVRLEAVPINLNSARKNDKDLIQAVFDECDNAMPKLFESFDPKMKYPKYTSWSRSKYAVGFLCKYLNTYVFRVFSRNDVYSRRVKTGVTVMQSDTTEILRALCVNGKVYFFSKNLSYSNGFYNNSIRYNKWHISESGSMVLLNEVIRVCDCEYLNDYISENDIACYQYVKLLMSALHNNKAEIVFKNKLFSAVYGIENLDDYLEEFTSKQIDFASKNNVINTLPVIKRYGLYDPEILKNMESIMKKRRWNSSTYENMERIFERLNFDSSDLGRRLINFLKKTENFNASVYDDYVRELEHIQGVTIRDFFDKDYIQRLYNIIREKKVLCNKEIENNYIKVAKELSWIDREENGYFIVVPKTISDFKYEGDTQHNCVYGCGYFERVIKRQSIIVFLREKKDTPYVTIEFDYETFDVLQALGKYNQRLDRRLYQFIVDLGKQLSFEMLSEQ